MPSFPVVAEPDPGRAARGPAAAGGYKTFLAVVGAHFLVDLFGGIWPVYKKLAGLDLAVAGRIATVTLMIGTASQLLFGMWADRRHRGLLIVVGSLMAFLAMLLGPLTIWRDRGAVGVRTSYALMFAILLTVRLGQGMFHPAGAGLAANFSPRRRSTLVAVFIAFGGLGFAFSQSAFSAAYQLAGRHTELLLIPGAALWVLIATWCRPPRSLDLRGVPLRSALGELRSAKWHLLLLFVILALNSGVNIGLYFLLPEFVAERGYPEWLAHGGAFAFLIMGSVFMMIPAGHLADRIGRRFMLIVMLILSAVSYHAIVRSGHLPIPAFLALCLVGGGFLGTVNPLGVSFGQHLSPRNVSMISAVMMGMAWCVGSLSPGILGSLAKRIGAVGALTWLGVVPWVMIGLGLLLPGGGGGEQAASGRVTFGALAPAPGGERGR